MSTELIVGIIGFCATVSAAALAYSLRRRSEKITRKGAARTELLLALDRWWNSIKDYEMSMGEMGSASEHRVVPSDSEIATQLEEFRIAKIKTWPHLDRKSKHATARTEEVFLRLIARIYSPVYGHEVFGDQVPRDIARNDRIREIISEAIVSYNRSTFSECAEAYEKARELLEQ